MTQVEVSSATHGLLGKRTLDSSRSELGMSSNQRVMT